jgi:hypothetical protein
LVALIGAVGVVLSLFRPGEFPSSAIVGSLMVLFGLGLRASQMWAWWALISLAAISLSYLLVGIVLGALGGTTDATVLWTLAGLAVVWGLILWVLLRSRQRV